jgi:hypothetical protein
MGGNALYDPGTVLLFHEKRKHEVIIGLKMGYYVVVVLWLFVK